MATFVKLTNGEVVNIQYIKSIKRQDDVEPGAFRRAMREGRDEETGTYRIERIYTIQLQLGNDLNPLVLKYESEEERNTEFERLESILVSKPPVLFSSLALRPEQIQSLHMKWTGQMDSTLEVRIKAADTKSFVVLVRPDDTEDWNRLQALVAQLGLTIPKTVLERTKELQLKGYGTL